MSYRSEPVQRPHHDAARGDGDPAQRLDADLFRAALHTGLAGLVLLGTMPEGERRAEIEGWAGEAGVFLMAQNPRSREPGA